MKTGLAVTTLILGVLGFLLCPPAGIAAIVTGIIALNRINREPHIHGGRGMAIGGLVCGGASLILIPIMALLISILLPPLSRARELSKRLVCASNIKGIGVTLKIYSNDFPNQGIPTLQFLVNNGYMRPKRLICPSSGLNTCNYVFLLPQSNELVDYDRVVAFEPKSNHGNEGGNVLFSDGHTRFVRPPEYDRIVGSSSSNP